MSESGAAAGGAMPPRLVVIGIDAASPALIEGWTASGKLPHLGRLMASGASGRVHGPEGFFVGSTWPSFSTGLSPAGHGLNSLVQVRTGSYEYFRPAQHGLFAGRQFWEVLGDAGRRVAILDVPLSRLSRALNGLQTVEWGSHDAVFGFCASSAPLERKIRRRYGMHPLGTCCDGRRTCAADYRVFLDKLAAGIDAKAALTLDILGQDRWDLVVQVFTEAHCAGHQCWHLHDAGHPAHDPGIASVLGDPMLEVYQRIDRAIGRIVERCGDASVLVFSAHGMSHWYGAQFLLPEILFRLGVSAPAPANPTAQPTLLRRSAEAGWSVLPDPVKGLVRPALRWARSQRSEPVPSIGVDPRRSRCFVVDNGKAVGGIRLNLRGREPMGILEPGAEADRFCESLRADLLDIVEAGSGRPLVRAVRRTRDLYQGPALDQLPDLLVEWNSAIAVGSTQVADGHGARVVARSPRIGEIEGRNTFGRTGEHRAEGFVIARGPGSRAGRLVRPMDVLDFAPTLMALLGVSAPYGLDGRPHEELLQAMANPAESSHAA